MLNGLLAHYVNIPPLIVTLCTGYIFQGVAYAFHQTTGGFVPPGLREVLTAAWGPLSVPLLLYVLFILAAQFLLRRTALRAVAVRPRAETKRCCTARGCAWPVCASART